MSVSLLCAVGSTLHASHLSEVVIDDGGLVWLHVKMRTRCEQLTHPLPCLQFDFLILGIFPLGCTRAQSRMVAGERAKGQAAEPRPQYVWREKGAGKTAQGE